MVEVVISCEVGVGTVTVGRTEESVASGVVAVTGGVGTVGSGSGTGAGSVTVGSGVSVSPGSSVGWGSTGQTVVEMAMVSVTTVVDGSSQSGRSGPQSVTVWIVVVKMVEVVISGSSVVPGVPSGVVVGVGTGVSTGVVGTTSGVVAVGVGSGVSTSVVGTGSSDGVGISTVGMTSGSVVGMTSGSVVGGTSGSSLPAAVVVTGQTVVEMAMVSVTRIGVPLPGQSGTSGAQEVTVWISVVKMVEVVKD